MISFLFFWPSLSNIVWLQFPHVGTLGYEMVFWGQVLCTFNTFQLFVIETLLNSFSFRAEETPVSSKLHSPANLQVHFITTLKDRTMQLRAHHPSMGKDQKGNKYELSTCYVLGTGIDSNASLAITTATISKATYCLVSGYWDLVTELRNLCFCLILTRILTRRND